jgi:hypothetical protein
VGSGGGPDLVAEGAGEDFCATGAAAGVDALATGAAAGVDALATGAAAGVELRATAAGAGVDFAAAGANLPGAGVADRTSSIGCESSLCARSDGGGGRTDTRRGGGVGSRRSRAAEVSASGLESDSSCGKSATARASTAARNVSPCMLALSAARLSQCAVSVTSPFAAKMAAVSSAVVTSSESLGFGAGVCTGILRFSRVRVPYDSV